MAAKPQMTVRLAPSILHALIYISEREGTSPAELARAMITSASQLALDRHGWRVDCQDAYMRWLSTRSARERENDGGDIDLVDGESDGEDLEPASSTKSGADGPYGPSATIPRLFEDVSPPARPLSAIIGEADRLVAQSRPDGRKRRT